MSTLVLVVAAWTAVSLPAALAIGALIERYGADGEPRTVDQLLPFEDDRP